MVKQQDLKGLLPVAVGIGFSYLIFNPPEWIRRFGIAGFLIPVAFLLAGILVLTMLSLWSNLPAQVLITVAPAESFPEEMRKAIQEIEGLGFVRVQENPLLIHLTPPVWTVPLVNETERTYSTVFKTGSVPARISFDFISFFLVHDGGLSTSPLEQGGVLPASSGAFKQLFPGDSPTALFQRHKEGMAFLKRRNLEFMPVSKSTFERDFRASMAQVRKHVLSSPVSSSWIALWRTITKKSPHFGSIQNQAFARKQIDRIQAH